MTKPEAKMVPREPVAWWSRVVTPMGTTLQKLGFTEAEARMENATPVPLFDAAPEPPAAPAPVAPDRAALVARLNSRAEQLYDGSRPGDAACGTIAAELSEAAAALESQAQQIRQLEEIRDEYNAAMNMQAQLIDVAEAERDALAARVKFWRELAALNIDLPSIAFDYQISLQKIKDLTEDELMDAIADAALGSKP